MAELGRWLKSLRKSRGMSVDGVSAQAGVDRSTVYRWEQGKCAPRVDELLQVMHALRATKAECQAALSMLDEPRGIQALRGRREAGEAMDGRMPAIGDLLRALRLRLDMTQGALADSLRVNRASVARWEDSEDLPSPDVMPVLLSALNASPEERAYLSTPSVHLGSPLADSLRTEEACEAHLAAIGEEADGPATFAGDLYYLAFEAHLWRTMAGHPYAARLLRTTWLRHAQYLLWGGRLREMDEYLQRLLANGCPPDYQVAVDGMTAHFIAHGRGKGEFDRAAAFLADRQDLAEERHDGATIFRDMGDYFGQAGRHEEGIRLVRRSRELAEKHGDGLACRMADLVEARTLTAWGRPHEALAALPKDDAPLVGMHLFEHLERARASLFAGARSDAGYWLNRFYELAEQSGMGHMRPHGDFVAERL